MRPLRISISVLVAASAAVAAASPQPPVVTRVEVPNSCSWLERDNCWTRMLEDFDECAPPPVRADLHVDGYCRYYDGTMVAAREEWEPADGQRKDARVYELAIEIYRNGEPCFSLERTVTQDPPPRPRTLPVTKKIVTEITSRSGTLRYVEVECSEEQEREYRNYLRSPHARGSAVIDDSPRCDPRTQSCFSSSLRDGRPRGLARRAFSDSRVGFLTCPTSEMVIIGFYEYRKCPEVVPFRPFWTWVNRGAFDFAFTQPHRSSGVIACGYEARNADHFPVGLVGQNVHKPPLPSDAFPEEGPIPKRLFPPGRHSP